MVTKRRGILIQFLGQIHPLLPCALYSYFSRRSGFLVGAGQSLPHNILSLVFGSQMHAFQAIYGEVHEGVVSPSLVSSLLQQVHISVFAIYNRSNKGSHWDSKIIENHRKCVVAITRVEGGQIVVI